MVATNRRYMRGAGTADHTGDYGRHTAQKFNACEAMSTCALTKTPLFSRKEGVDESSSITNTTFAKIVADPYGVLYHKEAAVQALLRRKQHQQNSCTTNGVLGMQVRRLADLYDVRFYRENHTSICPITGKALTGSIPAILLVPGKDDTPNVVSESALKQLSAEELEDEHGPILKRVRLAPPPAILDEIKKQLEAEQEQEEMGRRAKKAEKATKKKRKRTGDQELGIKDDVVKEKKSSFQKRKHGSNLQKTATATPGFGGAVQVRVATAIQQNSVLSSIFTNKDAKKVSEKEKKDNLFAR